MPRRPVLHRRANRAGRGENTLPNPENANTSSRSGNGVLEAELDCWKRPRRGTRVPVKMSERRKKKRNRPNDRVPPQKRHDRQRKKKKRRGRREQAKLTNAQQLSQAGGTQLPAEGGNSNVNQYGRGFLMLGKIPVRKRDTILTSEAVKGGESKSEGKYSPSTKWGGEKGRSCW